MGTISFTCSQCGRQLTVPERYQGRDLKCPSCGRPFRAEASAGEPAPAVPPAPQAFLAPEPEPPFENAPFEEPPAPPAAPEDAAAPVPAGESAPVYWRVRRIGVLSLAALSALLHAVLGLIVGVVVAIAAFTPAAQEIPFLHGPLLAVAAVVGLPLLYAVVGFLAGAVSAVVYNLGARLTGGVSLLLD